MKMTDDDVRFVYYIVDKYYRQYLYDEDMMQEAMLAAHIAFEKVDKDTRGRQAYISKAIKGAIIKEYNRRQKKIVTTSLDAPKNIHGKKTNLHEMLPSYLCEESQLDLPNWMTDRERTIVTMYDAGYTLQEIGNYLGVSRQRVCEIRDKLREKVVRKGYCDGCRKRRRRAISGEGTGSGE